MSGIISSIIPAPATASGATRCQPLRAGPCAAMTISTAANALACTTPPISTSPFPNRWLSGTASPVPRIEPTATGGLRIGALVRNTDLAADTRVRRDYGVLSRALLAGASGQLRNRATVVLPNDKTPYGEETNPDPATPPFAGYPSKDPQSADKPYEAPPQI